ncbi:hypothetical protein [Streptomyces sp. NPDC048603]|uniref:hypothetical protein n=1 Tax=Streptomyces sp. NPDC048603 TaxID=3365577 RepID=UPI00371E4A2B
MRVELHIERLVVDAAQLHGTHPPAREREFREALTAELAALLSGPAPWAPRRTRSLTVPATTPPDAPPAAPPPAPPDAPGGTAAASGRAAARSLYAALAPGTPSARTAPLRREAP